MSTIHEPKSTHDTMLAPEDLVGGASAIRTALKTNEQIMQTEKNKAAAAGMTGFGDFLSGKLLRTEEEGSDPFERVKSQATELDEATVTSQAAKL